MVFNKQSLDEKVAEEQRQLCSETLYEDYGQFQRPERSGALLSYTSSDTK
ncbi:11618_t:CDS:2 [Dentiscutata erythropus]|uniref:11618_t:CDS:1 n=1 Tax=Dentiscutata erythropus TaxID=1348616 RepID=A0A9N8WF05_9GLOM|nr:11618_t:CDS:2 [Dentiscutata erythropus]